MMKRKFKLAAGVLPSTRLAVYVGLGGALWIVAAAIAELGIVALVYDLVLVVVALMDLLFSPRPRDFELERAVDEKMNLGVPNPVTLKARSQLGRALQLTLRDEPPLAWPVTVDPSVAGDDASIARPPGLAKIPQVARVQCRLQPSGEIEATYMVTPTRRGDFTFGNLSGRYATALGFWHRQFTRPAPTTVRVYPDTTEVRRYELRLRQGRLRDMGLHLLRLRGQGTEFESLREYNRDDEYKNINWKASARHGKLISNNFEIERDQTVLIAIDCGRMMTAMAVMRSTVKPSDNRPDESSANLAGLAVAGVGPVANLAGATNGDAAAQAMPVTAPAWLPKPDVAMSKLDCAINATVLLAHVAASMGDAVGLLLFADNVLGFVPPRKGKTQTGTIIEALYGVQPDLVEPDYIGAYEYLMGRKIRRSLVVTFTDLIDPEASRELLTASGSLRRHHNALCVSINNRDVIDMANAVPESTDEVYQKAMAQRMLRHRFGALETLRQHGVGILDVEASELTIATVNRYLDLKARAAL